MCINVYGIREFNNDTGLRGNEGEAYENIDARALTIEPAISEAVSIHFRAFVLAIYNRPFFAAKTGVIKYDETFEIKIAFTCIFFNHPTRNESGGIRYHRFDL